MGVREITLVEASRELLRKVQEILPHIKEVHCTIVVEGESVYLLAKEGLAEGGSVTQFFCDSLSYGTRNAYRYAIKLED